VGKEGVRKESYIMVVSGVRRMIRVARKGIRSSQLAS
jgi:hypothetical protein